jgi:hypothetical protein
MEKLQIAKYARRGFWITSNILEMVDEDCYSFVHGLSSVGWHSDNWLDADWLTENGTEDLRFFSYHVVLFRRSQYLANIQLERMIEGHVDAGTLPAKTHQEGERIFNPHEFKSWWFKHDIKTYAEQLGFAPLSPLYEVFDEMEKIDETNQNSPLEKSVGKVAKAEKVNKDKIQDFPRRQLSNWSQVSFCSLIEKNCLETTINGEPFSESDLIDNGLSKGNLAFLSIIVYKNGFFDKSSFPKDKNLNQSVTRLNNSLQKVFKINQAPISYNTKALSYKAIFQTKSDSSD